MSKLLIISLTTKFDTLTRIFKHIKKHEQENFSFARRLGKTVDES